MEQVEAERGTTERERGLCVVGAQGDGAQMKEVAER